MATLTGDQATSKRHIVVEADIFFEKDESAKEYSKYLQASISAVCKMAVSS